MTQFIQTPFNLQQGPLVRALLLQLAPEEHILLLVFHQIIFDGPSGGIFLGELAALYQGKTAGREAALPDLSIQYADYTLWQQKHLPDDLLAAQRDYWRRQLSRKYQPLSLPADRPRPARERFAGAASHFTLPPELAQALKTFSRREGVTLFAALLAGFNALLHLYSGQEDILVFTSAEGRTQPQLKPLIGLFSRQLPLRTAVDGRPTFRALVARAGRAVADAFANQDVPFSELVQMIRPAPGHSPASLFQAMFIFHSEPRPDLTVGGLRWEPVPAENLMAKFDWRLQMVDQGDQLLGSLEYKTDRFDAATMEQVVADFRALLTAVIHNPDRELAALSSLIGRHTGPAAAPPQPAVPPNYVNPRDWVELALKRVWEEAFGLAPIGVHDDFFELGGHSLLAVRLLALVEAQTGRKLPLSILLQAPTIAQLAELIHQSGPDNGQSNLARSHLIPIKSGGSRAPFFFVPPAGTTVLKYAGWSSLLDETQPFYGLEPLGLEENETPQTTVEEMAAHYLQIIRDFQPDGPYFLGGQCFGGLVAFEMARRLRAQSREVALLAVIDTELPPRKPAAMHPNGRHPSPLLAAARAALTFPWNAYVFFRKTYKRTQATRMWAYKNPLYLLKNIAIWRRYSQTLQAHLDARVKYVVSDAYPGRVSLAKFSTSDHEEKDGRWEWDDLALGGLDVQLIEDDEAARQNGKFAQQLRLWLKEQLDQAQQPAPNRD